MKKTKQELIEEIAIIAKKHLQKKEAVEKIFSDLDKETKMSNKHLGGIAAVNELVKEMKILEDEHEALMNEIKNK